jgi:sec-independent protein translocase protein TatB
VFDIGWSEMAIIMLLALIIIGPKDLPRVARTIGQWVRKGRMLAREFQTSLEDMARETELEDVKKEIEKVGRTDFKKSIENTIDPKGELTKAFDTTSTPSKPEPSKTGEKPALTDQSATAQAGKEASTNTVANTSANGHANGSAGSPSSSPVPASPVKAKAETKTAAKKTTARKTAAAKSPSSKAPASKAKTTAKTKQQPGKTTSRKTTSRQTSAAKKPVSSTKKSAKSETSTRSTSTKRSTAKPDAGGLATPDDGDGADRSAVAAKSS